MKFESCTCRRMGMTSLQMFSPLLLQKLLCVFCVKLYEVRREEMLRSRLFRSYTECDLKMAASLPMDTHKLHLASSAGGS